MSALVATKEGCEHLVLSCVISSNETSFNTVAMADCGATASAFIDYSFAQLQELKFTQLQYPRDLTVADEREVVSGAITNTVQINFALEDIRGAAMMRTFLYSGPPFFNTIRLL